MISKESKIYKSTLKLKQKKYREQENKFIIEGLRFVQEALKENIAEGIFYTQKIMETEALDTILSAEVNKYELSDAMMKEICDTENPQGIAAVVRKKRWSLDSVKNDFLVVADGIQDPGNLGTIIRTADAVNAGGVVIIKGTVDVYNSKTLRSTMGSIFHIPVIFYNSFELFMNDAEENGYNTFASSLDTDKYIYNADFKEKTAIVIGNEANGIPENHIRLCSYAVKIPMPGRAESLNAASAAAVIIYEVLRQRLTM